MDWEAITGISIVVVALCALILTIWQIKQTQKHNMLSFKPHLTSWFHGDCEKGVYTFELMNNGLGPALIESFTVKVDGKIVSGEETESIEKGLKILFPNSQYQSHQAFVAKGYSMAAKEKLKIVEVKFADQTSLTPETIKHAFNRADLVIKYKSFYEQEYTYSSEDEKSNN